jgi:hypothetical protein
MNNQGKKFAAALAAVQLYLEEEEAALAQAEQAAQANAVAPSAEPGSGRSRDASR